MEKNIHDYLSRHYYLKISDIGNAGLYSKADVRRHKPPFYSDKLLEELSSVFSLDIGLVKQYVCDWIDIVYGHVDLSYYWETQAPTLPTFLRVTGGTVSNELIQVQPMSRPSNDLFYLDYCYSGTTGLAMPSEINPFNTLSL